MADLTREKLDDWTLRHNNIEQMPDEPWKDKTAARHMFAVAIYAQIPALIAAARKGLEAEDASLAAMGWVSYADHTAALAAAEKIAAEDRARAETAERERDEAKKLVSANKSWAEHNADCLVRVGRQLDVQITEATDAIARATAAEASLAEAYSTSRALGIVNERLTARVAELEAGLAEECREHGEDEAAWEHDAAQDKAERTALTARVAKLEAALRRLSDPRTYCYGDVQHIATEALKEDKPS